MTTTNLESLASRARRRADFARDAVFAEFGGRQARALDYQDFRDRRPNEAPARLDEITEKELRRLWWCLRRRHGVRLPAQRGVIVREGGRG